MSFKTKLQRLEVLKPERLEAAPMAAPPAPTAAPDPREEVLNRLRDKMAAVMASPAHRKPERPPIDLVDLPFAREQTPEGPLYSRTLQLSAAHRMGRGPVVAARDASSPFLALLALDPTLSDCAMRGALYLDTETTGLSGGTGTIAFLVGLAFWSAPSETSKGDLVVEQLLVRNLGEEAPMLARVAERIEAASMLVTFNGKSFDLPLLRTRFAMAKKSLPKEPPHLDLVHVSRRIHKGRSFGCKLTTLEREVLGFERVNDVPSGEVSACYLHFLRTGDGRALMGVVDHNAWDVIAMAALVGLYGEPIDRDSMLGPEDLVGVARTLLRAGSDQALEVASTAMSRGGGSSALRARADIAKARGDRTRALLDFELLASTETEDATVRLELAKLYEHHVREPARALAMTDLGTGETPESVTKRRRRLTRKVERAAQDPVNRQATLFGERAGARKRSKAR